jgi:hypothetical protein
MKKSFCLLFCHAYGVVSTGNAKPDHQQQEDEGNNQEGAQAASPGRSNWRRRGRRHGSRPLRRCGKRRQSRAATSAEGGSSHPLRSTLCAKAHSVTLQG